MKILYRNCIFLGNERSSADIKDLHAKLDYALETLSGLQQSELGAITPEERERAVFDRLAAEERIFQLASYIHRSLTGYETFPDRKI